MECITVAHTVRIYKINPWFLLLIATIIIANTAPMHIKWAQHIHTIAYQNEDTDAMSRLYLLVLLSMRKKIFFGKGTMILL